MLTALARPTDSVLLHPRLAPAGLMSSNSATSSPRPVRCSTRPSAGLPDGERPGTTKAPVCRPGPSCMVVLGQARTKTLTDPPRQDHRRVTRESTAPLSTHEVSDCNATPRVAQQRMRPAIGAEIARLYQNGSSTRSLATELGVSKTAVLQALNSADVERCPRGGRNARGKLPVNDEYVAGATQGRTILGSLTCT